MVGLVASKVKEKYYRPVIAFAESSETELKGSGRSIPGVHLRDALELLDTRHPGLMGKFGGHAMAAGLTLPKANIEAFGRAFEAVIGELVTPELLTGVLLTDGELLPDELSLELAELIRASGPWGQAFPSRCLTGNSYWCSSGWWGEAPQDDADHGFRPRGGCHRLWRRLAALARCLGEAGAAGLPA